MAGVVIHSAQSCQCCSPALLPSQLSSSGLAFLAGLVCLACLVWTGPAKFSLADFATSLLPPLTDCRPGHRQLGLTPQAAYLCRVICPAAGFIIQRVSFLYIDGAACSHNSNKHSFPVTSTAHTLLAGTGGSVKLSCLL